MSLDESGGGQKRRKKTNENDVSENAKRQALWRKRHPEKYEAYKERRRTQARMRKGEHKPGGFLIYERMTESGEIIDVRIRHHLESPPENERLSDFLPHSPVNWALAKALRDARLQQLKEWRAEQ
jgi:hypothetical protein